MAVMLVILVSAGSTATGGEDGDPLIRIGSQIVVDASRDRVWEALTTPEGLAGWIAPASNVELTLGGPYELYFHPDNAEDRGMEGTVVLAYVPGEMLATTGELAGTWSVWRLDDAAGGGTRVRFDGLGRGAEWKERSRHFEEVTPAVLARLNEAVESADPHEATGASDAARYAPMAPFARLVGRSWRGEGRDEHGEPIEDVVRWERILGGRAVQATHSVGEGAYGGTTVVFFDEGDGNYVFHYFTTGGFLTHGTLEPTDTGFTTVEAVEGHATIREVRSETVVGDNGYSVSSKYLRDGRWVKGHGFEYVPALDARPRSEP